MAEQAQGTQVFNPNDLDSDMLDLHNVEGMVTPVVPGQGYGQQEEKEEAKMDDGQQTEEAEMKTEGDDGVRADHQAARADD